MNLRLVVVIGGNNIMVHLIDKTAVVEELERLYNLEYDNTSNLSCGKKIMLRNILSFLDTLEVKELDLEKEFDKCCENYPFDDECEVYTARRFFKLGFQRAQKGE